MSKGSKQLFSFLFGLIFGLGLATGVLVAWKKGEFEYGLTGLVVYLSLAALFAFIGFHSAFCADWTESTSNGSMKKLIAKEVDKGAALFESGQVNLAFSVNNEAIKLAEQYNEQNLLAKSLCNRGSCYQAFNQNTEALNDYNRSIELNPNDPITLFNRGELLACTGNHSEAKKDLFRAAEIEISIRPRVLYTIEYYNINYDDQDISW